jgi:hypothetical protein
MKRNIIYKQKEEAFTTSQHVNDILLPEYNALKDPYLAGYFDNPAIKKHLKETGVVRKKKKYVLE